MSEVYVVAQRSDGSVAHIAFQTTMRAPGRPVGPWSLNETTGVWEREASDENIEFELARHSRQWSRLDGLTLVDWRRLSQSEHELFETDRTYRDAIELVGGTLQHNIVKARDLHRAALRHSNGDKFMLLDRQWVDASASGDVREAEAVEAKRKSLRDFVLDPRIDMAVNLDELKRIVPPVE